ncbi:MAG TPA: nuclear transport factor 2 family protein [Chitinophagaceae bacterium]
MKAAIFFFLVIASLCSCQPDPGDQAKKEELKTVLGDYYDALAKKDLPKMNSLTTANFIMYDEGVIYNNETALRSVQEMSDFTVTFKFDSIRAHIDKENASAYYLMEASFKIKDSAYAPVKFLESATFEKEKKEWKIRFLHSTLRK